MKNRIILHLGLPKTGTTSLQKDVFPRLNCNYLGVVQPRDMRQSDLFLKISNYSISGADLEKETIRADLAAQLRFSNLLISEESFLVDSIFKKQYFSWQEKIRNLAELLLPFETEILVTLRKPLEGLESYYSELAESDYAEEVAQFSFVDFIRASNFAKIFDYFALDSCLRESFSGHSITYLPMEELMSSDAQMLLCALGVTTDSPLQVMKRNARANKKFAIVLQENTLAREIKKSAWAHAPILSAIARKLISLNTTHKKVGLELSSPEREEIGDLIANSERFLDHVRQNIKSAI